VNRIIASVRSHRWLVALGLVATFWLAFVLTPSVPDLGGADLRSAAGSLKGRFLHIEALEYDGLEGGATGTVVAQAPGKGIRVLAGSGISLVIAGPGPRPVPDVRNRDASEALSMLSADFFRPTISQGGYSELVPAGHVISQSPSAGVTASAGDFVHVVTSRGRNPVPVPTVLGLKSSTAIGRLRDSGFVVEVRKRRSCGTAGIAVAQSPAGAAAVQPGKTVVLTISKPDGSVPWRRARKYVGKKVAVVGKVVGVKDASGSSGHPIFINIGRDYPS